jgi:3-deoxy-manno-octulosonate cytidylyltransferase (CMP-KDO synthetase)
MTKMIVIPARLASQRLPQKLLRDETGWPLIRHVYELCLQVSDVDGVVVATDGDALAEVVAGFGGQAVVTPADLPTGTDRVAHACQQLDLADQDLVINVQGDEPEMDPGHVERLIQLLEEHSGCGVATLAIRRFGDSSVKDFHNPNRVKVLIDPQGRALTFTRRAVPETAEDAVPEGGWLQHMGIYGFRRGVLGRYPQLPRGILEQQERLEQLRLLESGCEIRVGIVDHAEAGIDTEQDYRRFVEKFRAVRNDQGGEGESGCSPAENPGRGETDDSS